MSRNSTNLIVSSIVTVIVAVAFIIFLRNHPGFTLTEEYQAIPEGFVLPKGCDIRIDMQTGETFAKISNSIRRSDNMIISPSALESESIPSSNAPPEYKNITKSRIQSRVSSDQMKEIESALSSLKESESSWEYLEDEAAAMEIGLAIIEATNFSELKKFLLIPDIRALKIVANCLQNNPLAIDKFMESKIHLNELVELFKKMESLEKTSFKALMRIIESVSTEYDFIRENYDNVKRHFDEHQDQELKERYNL